MLTAASYPAIRHSESVPTDATLDDPTQQVPGSCDLVQANYPRPEATAIGTMLRQGDVDGVVRTLIAAGRGAAAIRLAQEHYRRGAVDLAENLGQAALSAGLQEPQLYYLLAACSDRQGRTPGAIELARVGVALDQDPNAGRRYLAGLLIRQGRAAEAIAVIDAIDSATRDCHLLELQGLAYAKAGRPTAARAVFATILAQDPDHHLAQIALARLARPRVAEVLDRIERHLDGPLAVVFRRLRQGPASESEVAAALTESGYRRPLVKALLRELAAATRVGTIPLVDLSSAGVAKLETGALDAKG